MRTEAKRTQSPEVSKNRASRPNRVLSIIVGVVAVAISALSIWYLIWPAPLLVQGVVDATQLDIAARVDGRVAEIPVNEGQDVAAGAVLVRIDNPETIAKNEQGLAAKIVAEAQLANINAGTRAEVIAARKAALERAVASVILTQMTYDRKSQLVQRGDAPQAQLDQATDSLHQAQRTRDQAQSAYEQAVNGYTREAHEIAVANVGKAIADVKAVQSLVDLNDMWIHGRDAQGRRSLQRSHSSPQRSAHPRRDQEDRDEGRICKLA